MSKSKAEMLTALQSKKALATSTESEFDKVKEQLGKVTVSNKEHKDRIVKAKPKPCWIYMCSPIEHPTMLLTQVRHTQFDYVEVCEAYCKEHFVTYIIKDLKGNVLIKV